jgi:hypothetical protein
VLVVPSGTTVKPRNEANEVILESIKYFVFLKGGSINPCGGKFGAHASSCGVGFALQILFFARKPHRLASTCISNNSGF